MDLQLYKAASEGDINLVESLLRAERPQQLQQPDVPIHTMASEGNLNPRLYREVGAGPERAQQVQLGRPINRFLGVTYSGDTVLHIAAGFGHLQVARRICAEFRFLLLRGNNKSETPLHYAAQAGKHEVVDEFIQAAGQMQYMLHPEGVDVLKELLMRRNQDGETALYQAVRNKHFAVVEMLINLDPHLACITDNNNISPLYLAAMRKSPDIVNDLIESLHGDVSPKAYAGPHGQTALHAAALRKEGVVQSILNWKAELAKAVDDSGSTPLHFAVACNNMGAVKVLLENDKSSAYIADSSGLFPVHVASSMGYLELVIQLFEFCPDSDELLDGRGKNFLHIAVDKRKVRVVRWVCDNSKVVRAMNAKDDEGNTPMHIAVKAKDIQILAHLIKSKKVYIGVMNKIGLTPLDLARAQFTIGLGSWQNSEYIIFRTLLAIGSCGGINRFDHFIKEYNLEWDQEKMEKDAESYENMAKNMSIGSVLIASASFAGAFTVSQAYKNDVLANKNLPPSPGLSLAFEAYILMVVYAFICSITATALLIRAALTYIDEKYRLRNILTCKKLVMMAIRGFVIAFATGAYVILTPVSKWLAILVCLTGIVVPIFTDPHIWPNMLVARELVRSIGWKQLRRVQSIIPPGVPIQIRHTIHWKCVLFLTNGVLYGFIVLLVLVGSLINNILLRYIILLSIIVLLFLSFMKFMPSPITNSIIDLIIKFIGQYMLLLERGRPPHCS